MDRLWTRGGFPDSYLAANDDASFTWRTAFIQTYLERDVPALGPRIPAETLRRYWQMLAHNQGQMLNAAQLASGLERPHRGQISRHHGGSAFGAPPPAMGRECQKETRPHTESLCPGLRPAACLAGNTKSRDVPLSPPKRGRPRKTTTEESQFKRAWSPHS
jgi:hypothetical protein